MQMKYPAVASLTVVLWFGAPSSAQTPDLQQLKTKLQQLDQMMQELKQQIATAEARQNTPVAPVPVKTSPASKLPPPELPTTYIGELTRTRESQTRILKAQRASTPRILTPHFVVSSDCREQQLLSSLAASSKLICL